MAFGQQTIDDAWNRQGGYCAYCGKNLVKDNRDKGEFGAWHPHHRKPISKRGTDTLANCVIFCINEPENCHFRVGHKSNWANYAPLSDSDLPYLYAGQRKAQRQVMQMPIIQMQITGRQPAAKKMRRVKRRYQPPRIPTPGIITTRGGYRFPS